ncbi:hypothetical protein ZWY2020_033389 [Hordeum vulgare]|nr:hypothetical protein ZWY2020_033389 [Hordeum vulgare]
MRVTVRVDEFICGFGLSEPGSNTGRRFYGCLVQDGVRKVDYPKAMDVDKFEKKKEELEMEIQVDSDLIAQEKKELDLVVANLLNAGHGSKEKLEKIKAILEA